ncbi:CDGSH iron-sulfur domain-containing protein 3, mitochondrial-like [Acanthaster planci]|uniref:CDGSH iron-sulfur domain-containing protein 3, mitochondrial-like n=1 Tax=Acanthaster planci TaxID=133434 RepID=A0A8B7ZTR3_ACAPL|nr:CDGSH iron-sulfur domain-containing protein 3, mitochondrial-like [Acanthaster planci]
MFVQVARNAQVTVKPGSRGAGYRYINLHCTTAESMAASEENMEKKERLCPAVFQYGPASVRDLEPGKKKKWCTCGLSKKQPWCDGKHKGTGFKSLKWVVPEKPQSVYSICLCKHTKNPPFCDGTHTNLPALVEQAQASCPLKGEHQTACPKLCTQCGWVPDF